MTDSLEYKLRQLALEYSPKQVHDTMMNMFKQDYAFYQTLFCQKEEKVVEKSQQPKQPPPTNTHTTDNLPTRKEAKKVIVVRKQEPVQTLHLKPEEVDNTPTENTIDESTLLKVEENTEDKQIVIAAKQREKEEETHARLVSEGVNPETLLTKENLKDWVEVKKYNFAYIARELVGLTQNQVRFAAKAFNIQSPITERRKRIVGGKLASGR
jgi:hypothetical protein